MDRDSAVQIAVASMGVSEEEVRNAIDGLTRAAKMVGLSVKDVADNMRAFSRSLNQFSTTEGREAYLGLVRATPGSNFIPPPMSPDEVGSVAINPDTGLIVLEE